MFRVICYSININNRIVFSNLFFDTEEKTFEFELACYASLENFFIRVYENENFFEEISRGKFNDSNFRNFFVEPDFNKELNK